MLVLLIALILIGCTQTINNVVVSKSTAMIGEEVKLSVKSEEYGFLGCSKQREDLEIPGYEFQWSVEPSKGATVKNGVFVASKPGTYVVSVEPGAYMVKISKAASSTIVVQVTAAETTAAETTSAETIAAETTSAETTAAETVAAVELFNNHNKKAVYGGGTAPTFELTSTTQITYIETYHYTDDTPGAGTISLKGEDGKIYGPFQATGIEGQGGVVDAYWTVKPKDLVLPPGHYTIIDSEPDSFSQNEGSGGVGMVRISGVPQK